MIRCPHCAHQFVPAHEPLTKVQRETLTFLSEHIDRHGFAPTFDEIAAHFGLASLATVFERLTQLERKGVIKRAYNELRSITILVRHDELGAGV